MDFYLYIIAIVGGALAGAINTLAGSGSAITLTILTELMGLPPNMANGTNRIGILTQCWAGTYAFHKNGKLPLNNKTWLYVILTVVGAIAGVIVAVYVSNEQFKAVFSGLMVLLLFVILVKPKRWLQESDFDKKVNLCLAIPLYLALGFYGGFIQMGMGVFCLAVLVLVSHYNIIEGNAVKSFMVAIYTIIVIAIFQWKGLIDWKIGGIMAIGQTFGGWATATFASRYPKADVWAYRLLVVVVIFAILKLFGIF